uniref:Methyltranfer_dom domain-containing protein n=1 Tax=Ascaris lumbricoides TaxID=6252 RepID=A0A0M3IS57_ASCLU
MEHRGEQVDMRSKLYNSRNFNRIAAFVLVVGAVLGVGMVYNKITKQSLEMDTNEIKESSHRLHSTEEMDVIEGQLKERAEFLADFYKTPENLLLIYDYVSRDRNNGVAVIRELIHDGPPAVIMSRSRLMIPKSLPAHVNTSDWQIDYTHVPSGYIRTMLSVAYALGALNSSRGSVQLLTLGLGGGSVNVFLRHTYENVNVTAVEIDAAMVEMAKKYFGFVEDERQHCVVDDGIHFLSECTRKGKKFDVIILDACKNTEGFVECPQKEFMDSHVIQLIARALSEQGILLINLLTTGDGAVSPDTVEKAFEESLKWCAHFDLPGVTNKV